MLQTKQIVKRGEVYNPPEDESYWMYCQAYSRVTSKHCGQCNRWVYNFDHHCKWLNNCIGENNYKYFIMLVILFWLTTLIIFCLSVAYLVGYHTDGSHISKIEKFSVFPYSCSWILCIICFLKIWFSTHLLGFQIYVKSRGMSTYQYVLKKRQRALNKLSQRTDALRKIYDDVINDSSSHEKLSIQAKTLEEIRELLNGKPQIFWNVLEKELKGLNRLNTEERKVDAGRLSSNRKSKKYRQSQYYNIKRVNDSSNEPEELKVY